MPVLSGISKSADPGKQMMSNWIMTHGASALVAGWSGMFWAFGSLVCYGSDGQLRT